MKTITYIKAIIKLMLIAVLIVLPTHAAMAEVDAAATFQTGTENGIDYIAGGVGEDNRDALEAIARAKYNVKMVFAMRAGDYLSDIPVEITDKSGKKLLNVTSSGPFFYVKLPAGAYTLKATHKGVVRTQNINAAGALRQVVFTWEAAHAERASTEAIKAEVLQTAALKAESAEVPSTATFQTGSANGIDYIAGGIGDDDRDALNAIARSKYNIKLVFAMAAGNYVSDIPVEITNKSGKKLLEVISSGPIFYVKLPAGAYTIKAANEGITKTQNITAGTSHQQVVFTWQ
ncbi:MAG: hypothetical protein HQL01_14955 [Nitrospirae bacterium]|nr:hypothetical protein [Nitrospirota bacterium]